jgi:hypothetical protein
MESEKLIETLSQILPIISIISFVLAGVALLVAVILFVKFKIPSVIGDLSGSFKAFCFDADYQSFCGNASGKSR